MKMCRACLCIDKDLFSVDAHFLSSYNLLTHLNVKQCDSLPKSFCQPCMESVNFYIAFRDKCISSESTLRTKSVMTSRKKHFCIQFDHPTQCDFSCRFPYVKCYRQNIKVDECVVEIKREEDSYLDENFQYELVDFNREDDIKKAEGGIIETEPMEEKERNPEREESVKIKRPRGRPKRQPQTTRKRHKPLKKKRLKLGDEYDCGLCDESFIILDDLNSHIDGHRIDDRCGICCKKFENWPKLLAHRTIHSAQTRMKCHLCPRKFNTIYRIEQHYLHVHFEEKLKEMSCEHCQKTYTCPERFKKHLQIHNRECHICPEIFPSGRQLQVHLRTHDPEKRYECDQCEYTAIYASVLAVHKTKRHKKLTCKTCERKFADKRILKKHTCKDKSNICPICGQRFYNDFKRHLNSHKNVKTFKCERCPAAYKSRISLTVHLDRHDNNPRHACDYCGRMFYALATLGKHRRVHTGEKPYVCKICGKRFTGNDNLKVHMKVHGIMLTNKRVKDPVEAPLVGQATSSTSNISVKRSTNLPICHVNRLESE